MEPENTQAQVEQQVVKKNSLFQVTPLSKYLAMALFIALPFIGGWIGYTHAPEKIVEIEKVVVQDQQNEEATSLPNSSEPSGQPITGDQSENDLPFGSTKHALSYFNGTSGLSEAQLHQLNPGDILIDNVGPRLPGGTYTDVQVKAHNKVSDCYVVSEYRVYDITKLIPMKEFFSKISQLESKCGTDVTDFIAAQPVEAGSLNTAQFKYAFAEFFLGSFGDKAISPTDPFIEVSGYKYSSPSLIEVTYRNLPSNSGAFALCVPDGSCTEWADDFEFTTSNGTHTMHSPKGISAGEYVVTLMNNTGKAIVSSEPFEVIY